MISTMRRSNLVARACSKPVSPSRARSTAKPASRSPLARKAAVFFSSSITRIRIAESATSFKSPTLPLLRRGHSNHQSGQEKCECRREQAVATVRVQHEGLHIQKPKRGQKHRNDNRNQKCSRARVAESRECSEGEHTEVSQRAR